MDHGLTLRLALAAFLLISMISSGNAETGPSFDCTKAESGSEKLICGDAELADLDRRVSGRYAEALTAAGSLDAGADKAVKDLRASQQGWVKGRDECWKAKDKKTCVSDAYLRREAELIAGWTLIPPLSTATWTCEGNPANQLVTTFFETPLPSVRFERGDSVDIGMITRTASGARYDGSFGRFIWMKGNEATYRDPDPDGTEYSCVTKDD